MRVLWLLVFALIIYPLAMRFCLWLIARVAAASHRAQVALASAAFFVAGSAGVFLFFEFHPKGTPDGYVVAVAKLGAFLAFMWLMLRVLVVVVPACSAILRGLGRRLVIGLGALLLRRRAKPVVVASNEGEAQKQAPFLERV